MLLKLSCPLLHPLIKFYVQSLTLCNPAEPVGVAYMSQLVKLSLQARNLTHQAVKPNMGKILNVRLPASATGSDLSKLLTSRYKTYLQADFFDSMTPYTRLRITSHHV